jgi:hypothetical protein
VENKYKEEREEKYNSASFPLTFYETERSIENVQYREYVKVKVRVKVMLRPTVSRPVCLGIKHPSRA